MPKPSLIEMPAHHLNYADSRGDGQIQYIIIHTMQGTIKGTNAWFADPKAQSSAHYGISIDGALFQYVPDESCAWHAGNKWYNRRSIGIELEGFMEREFFPDTMMDTLAQLCRYLIETYSIPMDRTHIIGHREVPAPDGNGYGGAGHHQDPGENFPWDDLMSRISSGGPDVA